MALPVATVVGDLARGCPQPPIAGRCIAARALFCGAPRPGPASTGTLGGGSYTEGLRCLLAGVRGGGAPQGRLPLHGPGSAAQHQTVCVAAVARMVMRPRVVTWWAGAPQWRPPRTAMSATGRVPLAPRQGWPGPVRSAPARRLRNGSAVASSSFLAHHHPCEPPATGRGRVEPAALGPPRNVSPRRRRRERCTRRSPSCGRRPMPRVRVKNGAAAGSPW